ncbi:hypothetical protein B0T19DRAFT_356973 [Cercophora scortea]|uniref:Uncharacterized protein n=1 Tax=Cercophora scortea TaxID=314031 RepID=A0AAE0MEW7_9PEZI|nr:hypothetical protein B0T19DRAFT_356973 [Cercophora scortea]
MLILIIILPFLFAGQATAATWYFLRYFAPSGASFTGLTGQMVVPTLPKAATYYLWPGLQPTDGSGVYQNVLDGRKGTWWFGSGWCCSNPNLPWGGGFNTYAGDVNSFSNSRNSDGKGWTSTTIHGSSTSSASSPVNNTFALANKSFNQAIFAIELYDVAWNFGPLTFKNVKIIAAGSTSTSWCTSSPENYNSATKYTITGAKASVSGTTVTCSIDSIVLQSPA